MWRVTADVSLSVAGSRSCREASALISCMGRIAWFLVMWLAVSVPTYAAIPTSVSITSSADVVASGENFHLTISVNASMASEVSTGTITLYDGSKQLGVFSILLGANNTSSQVQLTMTPQLAGPYTFSFSAVYSGDSAFAPGTSPTLNVDVTQTTSYSA